MKKKLLAGLVSALAISGNAVADTSIEDKLAVLQEEIEHLKLQMAEADKNRSGGIQAFADRTTVGGYGELHYNRFGGGATATNEIDFHRFVLYFGHKFNDWISFKSEVEIEHSNTENHGEVELEQAYLDFNFNEKLNAKAGIFLLPLGFINETHEPPTFYGVERNFVENKIIPTTWWEAGVGLYGEIAPGWKYQANITSSPDMANIAGNDFSKGIREGRTNVSEAPAEDFGFSARLDYTGMPGLTVGGSLFTGNTGQNGKTDARLEGIDARLTLWDVHARYNKDRLDLRALYAQGHLDDAREINAAIPGAEVAEQFYGWYAEAAYKVWAKDDQSLSPFIRYERWDTHDDVPSNIVRNPDYKNRVVTVGANYWPHPQVVLKADYQDFDKPDGDKGDKRVNMGLGYMF